MLFFFFDLSQIRTPAPHVTSYMAFFQLNSTYRAESIEHLFEVLPNCNFSECQISVIPSCDLTRGFFCSRWAFPLINLVVSTRLAIYNSKRPKPNGSANPFRNEDLAMFICSHPPSLIAQSFVCRSFCQNLLFDSKDKLVGGILTKDSDHCTPSPAATRIPTLAVALVVAPLVVSGSANSSLVRYLENNF